MGPAEEGDHRRRAARSLSLCLRQPALVQSLRPVDQQRHVGGGAEFLREGGLLRRGLPRAALRLDELRPGRLHPLLLRLLFAEETAGHLDLLPPVSALLFFPVVATPDHGRAIADESRNDPFLRPRRASCSGGGCSTPSATSAASCSPSFFFLSPSSLLPRRPSCPSPAPRGARFAGRRRRGSAETREGG